MHDETTARRKDAHLDLCATEEVAPVENSTLLDNVRLIHCAMPELAFEQVSLGVNWFGKSLKAPLLMTGMTGGTERAGQVNRDLAQVAEEFGVAFGVGSQRAMAERPELASTFSVRNVAPNTVVIGNLGLVQATRMTVDQIRRLSDGIGADALAIHLNPAQELNQPEGDRDFQLGYLTITALAKAYGERLLVKETGCGVSPEVARRLVECGVSSIDVSGLGGTSWVRVEQLRSSGVAREVGAQFSTWGIPTAAAVASVRKAVGPEIKLVASGGMRTGLEIAKALALGADIGGMALPMFRAQQVGGVAGVRTALQTVITALTQALALTGSRNVTELRRQPRVVTGELKDWLQALG
ncbi:MAG: type 2 isopentenyl-diphosphate Delta-isomerase [Archangium sp.]|nr:type 2 isopentenyl-diphosphate Delta-isomerase [Archangium sp.]MDP3151386.1 type 2 isopentenyl-diphosphate Delta-isomerase [Archangium sp.]MDP3569009.1 type 2 isopentenyl-diphosphate Delta-isomerase [Archangium sp.]